MEWGDAICDCITALMFSSSISHRCGHNFKEHKFNQSKSLNSRSMIPWNHCKQTFTHCSLQIIVKIILLVILKIVHTCDPAAELLIKWLLGCAIQNVDTALEYTHKTGSYWYVTLKYIENMKNVYMYVRTYYTLFNKSILLITT